MPSAVSHRSPYPLSSPTEDAVLPTESSTDRSEANERRPAIPVNVPTGSKRRNVEDEKSSWQRLQLTSIFGRRRRFQRYALLALFLAIVYWVYESQQSAAREKALRLVKVRPGTGRRTVKPLHVRASAPIRASVPAGVVLQSRSGHEVKDGLLKVDMSSKIHPIYQLIRDAREEWDEKVASQSVTLKQAVEEYKRRNNGRLPPKGFDKWWRYIV
jgi:hypothetical protein